MDVLLSVPWNENDTELFIYRSESCFDVRFRCLWENLSWQKGFNLNSKLEKANKMAFKV